MERARIRRLESKIDNSSKVNQHQQQKQLETMGNNQENINFIHS